jgi:N-methylhydantoinase A/oxoprolinase/acetone carboxylase beta subunit
VLGYLDPEYFAGGTLRLDAEAAARGIEERLARPLGRDLVTAAWTVHDVVNETMAAAVRMHVTERGGNPERATLFAFGGAGPVHAYHLATKLGVRRIMVPLRAGVLSALGLVVAPAAYDLVRTRRVPLDHVEPSAIAALFDEMAREIALTLAKAEPGEAPAFARAVDVGYVGQGYQVTVAVDASPASLAPAELWRRFAGVYREKYGYFYDDVPAELVNLRLSGRLGGRELRPASPPAPGIRRVAPRRERPAFSARRGRMLPFAVRDRSGLAPGTALPGPAIVEEESATTVIDVGGALEVDAWGSLVITVGDDA